jgi:TRAP-type transport system periplasmic protein
MPKFEARLSRGRFARAFGALGVPGGVSMARSARAAETYTLRMSSPQPVDSALGMAVSHFASEVARRSNGQVKIEVYPSGQLAKDQESIDGVANGVIDFTVVSSSFLVPLFPRFEIFGAPFLFPSPATAFRIIDGPIGNALFAELEPKGIIGLGFGGGSFKEFLLTSKVVVVPDDLKGLRLRSVGGAVYNAIFQALGAIPITIDIAETYTALAQHTVDGLDAPLDSFISQKLYTVVKNVAMSNHILNINPIIGSKRKIEALPRPLQTIVREEGRAVPPFWRSVLARQAAAGIQLLKTNGVAFSEIQYPAFRKAMDPVYALLQSRPSGDLLERIRRTVS